MPDLSLLLTALRQHSSARAARSNALAPLIIVLGSLLVAFIGAIWAKSPTWVIIALFSVIASIVLLFVVAYLFLLFKDRDALRSESFSLTKMAIKKGYYGDNISGTFERSRSRRANKIIKVEDSDSKTLPPAGEITQ